MTRTPLSRSKGHQAALLSAALTRKTVAAVSVGTYSAWESTDTLRLLGGARGAWGPTGRRGAGHIVSPRAQFVYYAEIVTLSNQAVIKLHELTELVIHASNSYKTQMYTLLIRKCGVYISRLYFSSNIYMIDVYRHAKLTHRPLLFIGVIL